MGMADCGYLNFDVGAVVGCSQSEVMDNDQAQKEDGRVISVSASMPGDGDVQTRVALVETPVDDIDVTWKTTDVINLCFESADGTVVRTVTGVPITNISANGKRASFDIAIPADITGTFNLYGVHGAQFATPNSTKVVLPQDQDNVASTRKENYLHIVDDYVVLRFAAENITETATPQVAFEHIGSILGIWVENVNINPDLITLKQISFAATDGKNWLNNIGGEATYDIKTSSFVTPQPASVLNISHGVSGHRQIFRGDVKKFFRWVAPIDFQNVADIPAGLTVSFTDADDNVKQTQIAAKKLLAGRYYRLKFYYDTDYQLKPAVGSDGLMSHWPFDGNANDVKSGNDGVVNGNVTLTADRNGVPNSAYQFDGTAGSYIMTAQTGVVGTEGRTISFWAKADNISSANLQTVMVYGDDEAGFGGRFEVALDIEEIVTDISGSNYGLKSNAIVTNAWNFYTVVFEGGGKKTLAEGVRLYVNGVRLSTAGRQVNAGKVITNSELPIYFGSLYNSSRFFEGALDDVKIYRKVMDDAEVMAAYNSY